MERFTPLLFYCRKKGAIMFTNTEKKLYEKEIQFLQKQSKELLARCKVAEQYQHQYKELVEKLKKIEVQYQKNMKKSEQLLNEYQKYVSKLQK